jgi:hypothetical protein
MTALDRLKARLQLLQTHPRGTAKTDRTSADFGHLPQNGVRTTRETGSAGFGTAISGGSAKNGASSVSFGSPSPRAFPESGPAANDADVPLEPVGVVTDEAGDPALPCATCGGRAFHRAPGDHWRCSACEPPPPGDGSLLAGWSFCALPPDPGQEGPPAPRQDDDLGPGQGRGPLATAEPPDAPPWNDDRGWIDRWRKAGALADREPVVRAWIAAAPPQPPPRHLAAVELRRIAAQHGIAVELQDGPPARRGGLQDSDLGSNPPPMPPTAEKRPGGFPAPAPDGPLPTPPDPATAPIGRCCGCRWIAPLGPRGRCWACEREGRG